MDHAYEMCRTPVNQVVLMVDTEKKQGNRIQSIVSDCYKYNLFKRVLHLLPPN